MKPPILELTDLPPSQVQDKIRKYVEKRVKEIGNPNDLLPNQLTEANRDTINVEFFDYPPQIRGWVDLIIKNATDCFIETEKPWQGIPKELRALVEDVCHWASETEFAKAQIALFEAVQAGQITQDRFCYIMDELLEAARSRGTRDEDF
jgi:hypothetical protein